MKRNGTKEEKKVEQRTNHTHEQEKGESGTKRMV